MARSAFVTEEEVTVLHQGAKVGKSRGFYVGEDMWVVTHLMMIAEGDLTLSAGKIKYNLGIKFIDNATEHRLHSL